MAMKIKKKIYIKTHKNIPITLRKPKLTNLKMNTNNLI